MAATTAFARMLWFQTKIFAQNSYFVQLLLTSTASSLLLQVLAAPHAAQLQPEIWVRAGMTGCWAVCGVSTGLIGFQRFQGTLILLATAPIGAGRALMPVVVSAATFGLLAFPLAAAGGAALGIPLPSGSLPRLIVALIVFWIAAASISLVIAAAFVLTPNALVYEALVSTPVVLLSGVFGFPAAVARVSALTRVLPLRSAVLAVRDALAGGASHQYWLDLGAAVGISALWLILARAVAAIATRRALRDGTLDLI